MHCPPQLNHPKLPVLPIIAETLKRLKGEQDESEQFTTLRRKVIQKKPKARSRHRSIVVGVDQQVVDTLCEDEQRVRGHFYKVNSVNKTTGRR